VGLVASLAAVDADSWMFKDEGATLLVVTFKADLFAHASRFE
jgi:hypothetical protein